MQIAVTILGLCR